MPRSLTGPCPFHARGDDFRQARHPHALRRKPRFRGAQYIDNTPVLYMSDMATAVPRALASAIPLSKESVIAPSSTLLVDEQSAEGWTSPSAWATRGAARAGRGPGCPGRACHGSSGIRALPHDRLIGGGFRAHVVVHARCPGNRRRSPRPEAGDFSGLCPVMRARPRVCCPRSVPSGSEGCRSLPGRRARAGPLPAVGKIGEHGHGQRHRQVEERLQLLEAVSRVIDDDGEHSPLFSGRGRSGGSAVARWRARCAEAGLSARGATACGSDRGRGGTAGAADCSRDGGQATRNAATAAAASSAKIATKRVRRKRA